MKIIFIFLFTLYLQHGQLMAQVQEPIKYTEKMPEFPGGTGEMYKFIYSNLKYPDDAKKWKVSGQVITQFVVDKEGYLTDIHTVRGLGFGLDEEAMRVIELMNAANRWTPGLHNGRAVPVTFTLPIKFVLKSE